MEKGGKLEFPDLSNRMELLKGRAAEQVYHKLL
jgi:hypothetical protein